MKALFLVLSCGFTVVLYSQQAAIRKGNEFYKNGDFVLAEMQYRQAGTGTGQFNLANALIQQKKFKEALAVLQTLAVKEKDPGLRAAAYYNAGVIYSRQKDLASSIDAYKSALRNNPSDTEARENLQKALLEQKQQQKQDQQQNRSSKMNKSEAERQLQELQDKERKLQEKLQSRQKGSSMEKDW
jgi:Ca-activated chloride channel family protein